MGGKKGECLCYVLACVENARNKYLLELDVMQVEFLSFLVCNYHYLYWGWCRSEKSDVGVILKLFMGWYEFKLVGTELD
jgi:hypothetical protein